MKTTFKGFVGFTLLPIIAYGVEAFGQQNGYIEGSVFWDSQRFGSHPVDGANIIIYDSLDAEVGQDTTSAEGLFDFALPAGIYHAVFSKTGYRDSTLNDIIVIEAETTFVDWRAQWINDCHYIVGDVNGNQSHNGMDVTYSVAYFKGGPPPPYSCECTPGNTWFVAGDVNGSCSFNGMDVTYMVDSYKNGGLSIPCPDCPPIDP